MSTFTGLLDHGDDVHVVCLKHTSDDQKFFPQLGSELLEARVHAGRDYEATLQSLDCELIHFEFGHIALAWVNAGGEAPGKKVVSFRGFDLTIFRIDEPECYQALWSQVDAVHFRSNDLLRRGRARGCPPWVQLVVIPPGVDTGFFRPRDSRAALRRKADRPLRIVSVGRLDWRKGYDYGLKALQMLKDEGVAFEYRIIGEGEDRIATLFAIDDLELGEMVALRGAASRADVKESLGWADVFLHPAVSEGFGNAVLEAQAMALPVVTTDAGGLPENVADGHTGLVVPRRDPVALADRLLVLANDPELRIALGKAGRERVVAGFGLEREVRAFEELYASVIGQHNGRDGT